VTYHFSCVDKSPELSNGQLISDDQSKLASQHNEGTAAVEEKMRLSENAEIPVKSTTVSSALLRDTIISANLINEASGSAD
jgi:hypothetical protein